MASRYRKKFALPEEFNEILESYSREVLRDQPIDIVEFSYLYFKALEEVSRFASKFQDVLKYRFSFASIFPTLLIIASYNCRALSIRSTIQGKERTFHQTKLTGHQLPKRKKVKTRKKVKLRVTTTRMEIRLKGNMKRVKTRDMEKKQKKHKMDSMKKDKTMEMSSSRR